jgi:ABC-type nickel/cobalt efflux system permease component RcnA
VLLGQCEPGDSPLKSPGSHEARLLKYTCNVKSDHTLANRGAPSCHTRSELRTRTTLPDPAALAILLAAVARGKLMLALGTVLMFSLGFASTLVVVGVVAAKAAQVLLTWLNGPWVVRL